MSATQVSFVGYAVGGAFLNLAFWDMPYYLYAIVVLTGYVLEQERKGAQSASGWRPCGRPAPARPASPSPARPRIGLTAVVMWPALSITNRLMTASQDTMNVAALALFTAILAVGNLMFKQVGLVVKGYPVAEALLVAARSPWLYGALALYGGSTLLWIWILSRVTLMQAYPWVAVGMAIVPLLAWVVFDERVAPSYWLGVALVIAGVFLTQYAASRG